MIGDLLKMSVKSRSALKSEQPLEVVAVEALTVVATKEIAMEETTTVEVVDTEEEATAVEAALDPVEETITIAIVAKTTSIIVVE
jgi:hypothetical protein